MTCSHVLLHCNGDERHGNLRASASPRWEARLLRFIELSGVVDGEDEEEGRAARLDGVDRVGGLRPSHLFSLSFCIYLMFRGVIPQALRAPLRRRFSLCSQALSLGIVLRVALPSGSQLIQPSPAQPMYHAAALSTNHSCDLGVTGNCGVPIPK
jgi:hypothetical protein